MYPDWFVVVGLAAAVVSIWLLGLTILVWRQDYFLKSLFPKSGERDIRKKFEEIVKTISEFKSDLADLDQRLRQVQTQGLAHIQRVELLRFNPFDDTGGDQSFTVALLDSEGSGIVVTSLHARSGTRVFAKDIVLGKGSKHKLSKEEESVVKKALEK